jgi:8-oxo-dGTP pyrophosphatase MutT (NUDIX family)
MSEADPKLNNMGKFLSDTKSKDLYFVAVKLLLRDGDKLLITHDIFGSWDLPGGRIKRDEFEKPLEAVLQRKVREEIGSEIKYELGDPKVFFRVEREEYSTKDLVHIFAIGYEGMLVKGKPVVGEYHDKFEWVDVAMFKPEDYFTGGWLTGVQEYIKKVKA